MKRITPDERLTEGWDPSPSPVMGPGGQIIMPRVRRLAVIDPPSLCAQGPCVHYHELDVLVDAAEDLDGSGVGRDHHQIIKACYPTPGIEIDLNGTPVFECGFWEPLSPSVLTRKQTNRIKFAKSQPGKDYAKAIKAWRAEQKRIEDEAVAAAVAQQAEEAAMQVQIERNESANKGDVQPSPSDFQEQP